MLMAHGTEKFLTMSHTFKPVTLLHIEKSCLSCITAATADDHHLTPSACVGIYKSVNTAVDIQSIPS